MYLVFLIHSPLLFHPPPFINSSEFVVLIQLVLIWTSTKLLVQQLLELVVRSLSRYFDHSGERCQVVPPDQSGILPLRCYGLISAYQSTHPMSSPDTWGRDCTSPSMLALGLPSKKWPSKYTIMFLHPPLKNLTERKKWFVITPLVLSEPP